MAPAQGNIEMVYLLGADEIDMARLGDAFVIYQGSHGDAGAHRADVILPGAAYTEKTRSTSTPKGATQMTARAMFPPGEAREDWKIVRALSGVLGKTLPFDTVQELRAKMFAAIRIWRCSIPIVAADSRRHRTSRRASRPSLARAGSAAQSPISISPTRSRAPPPSWRA